MKPYRSLLLALALAAGFLAGTAALAADDHKHDHVAPVAAAGKLVAPTEADAAWLAKARAAYPLKTCVVSGDEFGGDMGEVVDRIYREKGKPDRLIRFCCDGCLDDFEKDPATYLRKLDQPAGSKSGHSKHQH